MSGQQEQYEENKIYDIPVADLQPNPKQVRKHFDENNLETLADSIKKDNLLQPIIFTVNEQGQKYVIAGERRWRAFKEIGRDTIPAIYKTYNEQQLRKLAFIENCCREDLNPIDLAESLQELQNEESLKQGELAKLVNLQRNTVSEILKINSLPENIKTEARKFSNISRDRLIKIARVKGDARQNGAWNTYKQELNSKKYESSEIKEGNNSKVSEKPQSTKGQIMAQSILGLSKKVMQFAEPAYSVKLSPEDRDAAKKNLETLKEHIETSIKALSDNQKAWDKLYAVKHTKKEKGTRGRPKKKADNNNNKPESA